MSRSRRKTPIRGITASDSEKQDKKIWHRRFRRVTRQIIARLESGADIRVPLYREFSNPWAMDKDGKHRFDPQKYPKLLRK